MENQGWLRLNSPVELLILHLKDGRGQGGRGGGVGVWK